MPSGQPANTVHKQEDTSWAHVLFLLLLSPTFQEFEILPPPHDLKYHQGTLPLISHVSSIHSPFLAITSPSAIILGTTGDLPQRSSCPLFCSFHLPKHRSYEPPTSALKLSTMTGKCLDSAVLHLKSSAVGPPCLTPHSSPNTPRKRGHKRMDALAKHSVPRDDT